MNIIQRIIFKLAKRIVYRQIILPGIMEMDEAFDHGLKAAREQWGAVKSRIHSELS